MRFLGFLILTIVANAGLAIQAPSRGREQVALLVRRTAFEQLKTELLRYERDVEARFPVRLRIVQGGWTTPEQVRDALKGLRAKSGVTGAVLVGAVPMHRFHMHDFDNPNALYYEDPDHT